MNKAEQIERVIEVLKNYDNSDWLMCFAKNSGKTFDDIKPILLESLEQSKEKINQEEALEKEYGFKIDIDYLIKMYIREFQKIDGEEELRGFKILTNADKDDYEQWKKDKEEREKNEPLTLEQLKGDMFHEYVWCSRTKAWGYVESKKRGEEYVPIIKFFWGWEWLEDCEKVYKYKKESD